MPEPFSSLEDIESRLRTGEPLNPFEFQRIFRNLNILSGVLRQRQKLSRTGMLSEMERARLMHLGTLTKLAIQMQRRPRPRPLGGKSLSLMEIEQTERRRNLRAEQMATRVRRHRRRR